MKNKTSEALLVLYYQNEESFIPVLKKLFKTQVDLSIKESKAEIKLIHYEKQLFDGIEKKSQILFMDALANLTDLYHHNGIEPTPNDSGYYHMLHFLLEIREAIMFISSEWPKK